MSHHDPSSESQSVSEFSNSSLSVVDTSNQAAVATLLAQTAPAQPRHSRRTKKSSPSISPSPEEPAASPILGGAPGTGAPPRMGGRPVKLTPAIQKNLVESIGVGAAYEDACNYTGISYQTFRNWMKAGEEAFLRGDPTGQFFEFFEAIKKAEGRNVLRCMVKIERAASEGDWRAAAWKLERRYPERYGRSVSDQRHSGQVSVQHDNLAQTILSSPAASSAAAALVAELAGIANSQDDPGWNSMDHEPQEVAISPTPEAD
jgi:transposase